ncbi:TMEM175 family protein [Mucilaginibacter ginkgonis]|uniref:DUF1211 domain-containing protein n=1 Tax=Mucilaginibacter ginkgonis TaxID=2682091 RepID=A0A7T7FCV9_9SPHI|nr:TMEM175 family protein [Mucilaginibacter ginkgonis]QQL50810.1 DUF1211 domain-containing protein [Mucilaginibacter ginkgonis]
MDITEEQQEIKKEFQLERVILFSDAIFAIIVTIMVIDIKLPEEARNLANSEIPHEFLRLFIKLMAYAASFFLVANFWMRHLKIFSFLRDYNKGLVIFNLLFLFAVSLFPFAVSLITGSFKMHSPIFTWGVNIYIGVILSSLMTQTLLTWYMVTNKAKLCINNNNIDRILQWKAQRVNLYLVPFIGLLVLFFNYFDMQPIFSLYSAALIGVVNARLRRVYYPKIKTKSD